jgi:hypothetical protein
MRWRPIIPDVALTIVVWTLLLWLLRTQRARMGDAPSPRAMRGHRVRTAATIAAAVGFTWFSTWLMTDTTGPHWLHSLSLPASLLFIAIGAIAAGYAGWIGGP